MVRALQDARNRIRTIVAQENDEVTRRGRPENGHLQEAFSRAPTEVCSVQVRGKSGVEMRDRLRRWKVCRIWVVELQYPSNI